MLQWRGSKKALGEKRWVIPQDLGPVSAFNGSQLWNLGLAPQNYSGPHDSAET